MAPVPASPLAPTTSPDTIQAQVGHVVAHLDEVNAKLADASPQQILEWAVDNLPHLYQTTAFGLTGCATLAMVSEISQRRAVAPVAAATTTTTTGNAPEHLIPLIFIDTLYHFPQTTDLAERASKLFHAPMHVFTAGNAGSTKEFEDVYGRNLWERDEDLYDYLVKVEPARRAYKELDVRAVLTGRRRSQGADRASLQAVEVDETGLIKVNALLNWSFKEVDAYIKERGVPYNELLDLGYRSIGDWHSTVLPSGDGDAGERSGRWAGKQGKTECGLHKDYFQLKKMAQKKLREAELARRDAAFDEPAVPPVA